MNTSYLRELSQTLHGYLTHLEYWDPDGGDAHLLLNAREWMESHLDGMTSQERESLMLGDRQLLQLSRDATQSTLDVEFLQETAKVVAASRLHHVASEHQAA